MSTPWIIVPSQRKFFAHILAMAGIAFVTLGTPSILTHTILQLHSEYLFQEGRKAYDQQNFLLAEKYWRNSLALQRKDPSLKFQLSESANNLGYTLTLLGREQEAESLLKEAICITGGLKHNCCKAISLRILGRLYMKQGRLREAEPLIKESLTWCEQLLSEKDIDTIASKHSFEELTKRLKNQKS